MVHNRTQLRYRSMESRIVWMLAVKIRLGRKSAPMFRSEVKSSGILNTYTEERYLTSLWYTMKPVLTPPQKGDPPFRPATP